MSKRSQARKREIYGRDSRGGTYTPPVRQAAHNTAPPVATGIVADGQTVTVSQGSWTGVPSPTLSYQWRADGVDIPGATTNSFVLTAAQVGKKITCAVAGANASGSEVAVSNELV